MQQVTENIVVRAAVQLVRRYDNDAEERELAVDWKILCEAVRAFTPPSPIPALEVPPVVEFAGENKSPEASAAAPAVVDDPRMWEKLSDIASRHGWSEGLRQKARTALAYAPDVRGRLERLGRGGRKHLVHREDVERLVEMVQPRQRGSTAPEFPAEAAPPEGTPPPKTLLGPTRKVPADESLPMPPIHTSPPAIPGKPLCGSPEGGRRQGFEYTRIDVAAAAGKWADAALQALKSGEKYAEIKLALSPSDCAEYAGIVETVLGERYSVQVTPHGQYHRIRVGRLGEK